MSYYLYAVFTHPPEQPWDISNFENFKTVCLTGSKLIEHWVAVLERGRSNENPHVNLIVKFKKPQANTSQFRTICLKYYKDGSSVTGPTLQCKTVWNLDGLQNYLAKEPDSELLTQCGFVYNHEEAKRLYQSQPQMEPRSRTRMPSITMKNWYLLNDYAEDNNKILRDPQDFQSMCKEMLTKGYGMFAVMQRPGYFWAHMNTSQSLDHFDSVFINNFPLN